jgi:SAM-dependent methyltransferase
MTQVSPWDTRFADEGFFYGTEPNDFLREHADTLAGPVLSLAEGEGRNAVFLAKRGLQVVGVDGSRVGLVKAQALAEQQGVSIQTEVADLADYMPAANTYATVTAIFAHLPSRIRQRLSPLLEQALVPGGILLLEAYSENQLPRTTGGPKDLDMLMTVDKVRNEFPQLEPVLLHEIEREVHEGTGHNGLASVVQFIGRKPA